MAVFAVPTDAEAPQISNVAVDPNPVAVDTPALLTAEIDDSATGVSNIVAVTYTIDGGQPVAMWASDGAFDSSQETALADVPGLASPGVYELCVIAEDVVGNVSAPTCTLLAVYDPSAGFVTGGGWMDSPPGACALDDACAEATGTVNFGFVCKYRKNADTPQGNTQINFSEGGLNFHSDAYDWLFIDDGRAFFQGTGGVNGTEGYGFLVSVIDADVDLIRLKIWDLANDVVIYDTDPGLDDLADPSIPLEGGQIVIHE